MKPEMKDRIQRVIDDVVRGIRRQLPSDTPNSCLVAGSMAGEMIWHKFRPVAPEELLTEDAIIKRVQRGFMN